MAHHFDVIIGPSFKIGARKGHKQGNIGPFFVRDSAPTNYFVIICRLNIFININLFADVLSVPDHDIEFKMLDMPSNKKGVGN